MNETRLLLIGGFLGAGKTTALLTLARKLHDEGQRVGLITNDQAANLVDTALIKIRGFRVEEVAGACFCCKFDDLAQAARRIRGEGEPQVILGEPVGSCTDLMATVIAPLRQLHGDSFSVGPYSVLVDPVRARQLVLERGFGGFSSKVAYIFLKQLEEAEIICLNKIDSIRDAERKELLGALGREFPRARAIGISALSGEGLEEWSRLLASAAGAKPNIAAVDYDIYAEGEAELGWLNSTVAVDAREPFDPNALVTDLLSRMKRTFEERGVEVAHIKVLLESPAGAAAVHFTGGAGAVRSSQRSSGAARSGRLVLNARVHEDPEELQRAASEAITAVLGSVGAEGRVMESTHFRPGRPTPTHRYLVG